MRVNCADCGKFMGEVTIEGKLRTGYSSLSVYVLCRGCHEADEPGIHAVGDDDAVEKLMGLFGMKK